MIALFLKDIHMGPLQLAEQFWEWPLDKNQFALKVILQYLQTIRSR
jgi:hypothetical protein